MRAVNTPTTWLPRRTPRELTQRSTQSPEPALMETVQTIVQGVQAGGEAALRRYVREYDGTEHDAPLFYSKDDLDRSLEEIRPDDVARLRRIASNIERFANSQRDALEDIRVPVPGGVAGHSVAPIERAGCYAPGGRYPLPSSVLMTAVTARAAGVDTVWVASPKPGPIILAAAAVAGADGLLAAGGAHAIAALAFGAGSVPPSDVVVGPGNRYVTAAKQLVAGRVQIDMLAGPSELVVVADASADPSLIAADLLGQAEHDPEALPILVSLSEELVHHVERALTRQLDQLPTRDIAIQALANGGVTVVESMADAASLCDALAPEHLQMCTVDPEAVAPRLKHYGALFLGERTPEVFGDYGFGPNHVLPTGRAARATGGLSVFTFLRVRTWMQMAGPVTAGPAAEDAIWMARVEGLEAHARSATRRQRPQPMNGKL